MILSERFDAALAWAAELHRRQGRKGKNTPYVAHLLGVASIALEDGCDEDGAIAALLHDAIEDQGVTVAEITARFGDKVAAIVVDCTDDVPGINRSDGSRQGWQARKEAYVAALADKPTPSLRVSLADKTYNARAIVDDLAIHGDALWSRFTGGRDGVLWYYRALCDAFRSGLPGPATERFAALVVEMDRRARG